MSAIFAIFVVNLQKYGILYDSFSVLWAPCLRARTCSNSSHALCTFQGRRESRSAALGITANLFKFDRRGQILWHYFATESTAYRHINDEAKGVFFAQPRPELNVEGCCHTVNTILHVTSYTLARLLDTIGVKLTAPHSRRSHRLAEVGIIGRQIPKVDGTDDAIGFMSHPIENVDLTVQRLSVLLTLRHHPECRP